MGQQQATLSCRQGPKFSDFVKNTLPCENHVSRAIIAWPCFVPYSRTAVCFFTRATCKKCDTNHIPRATAYCPAVKKPPACLWSALNSRLVLKDCQGQAHWQYYQGWCVPCNIFNLSKLTLQHMIKLQEPTVSFNLSGLS